MTPIYSHRTVGASASVLCLGLVLTACGSDPGPGPAPMPTTAPAVAAVVLDDVTNFGDGRDLMVSFDAPADETGVSEYRVLLVPKAIATTFDLAAAEAVSASGYTSVGPGPTRHDVTFTATSLDVAGNVIADATGYVAFVLSIAGGSATINALSSGSNPITIAVTSIKITYLGNAGVLVADDQHAVLIDALTGDLSGWISLAAADAGRLTQASSPFDAVDLVLVSHNHGDHFSPSAINSYFGANSQVTLIAPPQVLSGVSLSGRTAAVAPAFGTRDETTSNGVRVEVLHLRHFNQFGNDFSTVENYGFLVHLGGKTILHLGDVDYAANNLDPFDLDLEQIDVVILPTFNTLLSASNASVITNEIGPDHVVALHFQAPQVQSESAQATSLYPGAIAFTRPLEFVRY